MSDFTHRLRTGSVIQQEGGRESLTFRGAERGLYSFEDATGRVVEFDWRTVRRMGAEQDWAIHGVIPQPQQPLAAFYPPGRVESSKMGSFKGPDGTYHEVAYPDDPDHAFHSFNVARRG